MSDSELLKGEPIHKTNAQASDSGLRSQDRFLWIGGIAPNRPLAKLTPTEFSLLRENHKIVGESGVPDGLRGEYFEAWAFSTNVGIEGLAPYCNDPRSGNILLKLF